MSYEISTAPTAVDPDAIARQSFTYSKRGYDPREVADFLLSVASQVRALRASVAELREREADLQAALDDAEHRAERALEIDESRLTTLLGEETARIVEAARSAAIDIRKRAKGESEQAVAEAKQQARTIRAEAEQVLLHKTREADDLIAERLLEAADALQQAERDTEAMLATAREQAAELVAAARDEASTIVDEARTAAEVEIEAGHARGRELVAEAQAVRDRMLADLLERRLTLRNQVEQLHAGRERLLAAYEVVRETLDAATAELAVVLPEAKDAAHEAAARLTDDGAGAVAAALDALRAERAREAERSAEEAAASPADLGEATRTATLGTTAERTDLARDDRDAGSIGAAEEEPNAVLDTSDVRDDVLEPREPSPPRAPDPVEYAGRWSSSVRVIAPEGFGVPDEPEVVEPDADEHDADGLWAGEVADETVGAHDRTDGLGVEVGSGAGTVLVGSSPPGLPVETAADEPQPLTELVARIEPPPSAPAAPSLSFQETLPVPPAATSEPAASDAPAGEATADSGGAATDPEDDPDSALLAARDAALAGPAHALSRALKRALADEGNEVLDAVRRTKKGLPGAADVLASDEARLERYATAARRELVECARAGASFAAPGPAGIGDTKVDDLADELSQALLQPLRVRITRAFAAVSGTAADATRAEVDTARDELIAALRSAYRDAKDTDLDHRIDHASVAAFNRGVLDHTAAGTPVRWLLDHPAPLRHPGADADCAASAAAGEVRRGDPFPSGLVAPPAAIGCRCLVVATGHAPAPTV